MRIATSTLHFRCIETEQISTQMRAKMVLKIGP